MAHRLNDRVGFRRAVGNNDLADMAGIVTGLKMMGIPSKDIAGLFTKATGEKFPF
jgi:hypothetical protein